MRSKTSIKERKREIIFELREKGYSYGDIQKETGISKSTCSYHLGEGQKEKWKIRKKKNLPTYREKKREWMYQLKLNKPCDCCGAIVDPVALDFHHKERETKSYKISTMLAGNWCTKAMLKEIDKCILLCANCHRVVESNVNNDFYSKKRNTI